MFSTKSSNTQPSTSLTAQNIGWKWEVNHDGVVWSWYHPTPCYVSSSSLASKPLPAPSALTASLPEPPTNQERPSLVDYWYVVNDGVVVPNVNDW
jgi:hypothetical protein